MAKQTKILWEARRYEMNADNQGMIIRSEVADEER